MDVKTGGAFSINNEEQIKRKPIAASLSLLRAF